ncbi:hypothetical protein KR018_012620, partial [Drosophila ironensis]
ENLPMAVLVKFALFLGIIVNPSLGAHKYLFVFEEDNIFSKCSNLRPGFIGINDMFDMSNMHFDIKEDGVHVEGNAMNIWDTESTDRVEGSAKFEHWDRSVWQPTVLNMVVSDMCKVLYKPSQFWYLFITKNVRKDENGERHCFLLKNGKKVEFDPFVINSELSLGVSLSPGRHRLVIELVAYDSNNVQRPNGVCFEIKAEVLKL